MMSLKSALNESIARTVVRLVGEEQMDQEEAIQKASDVMKELLQYERTEEDLKSIRISIERLLKGV